MSKFNGYYVYTYLDAENNPYYVGMGKDRPQSRRDAQDKKMRENA